VARVGAQGVRNLCSRRFPAPAKAGDEVSRWKEECLSLEYRPSTANLDTLVARQAGPKVRKGARISSPRFRLWEVLLLEHSSDVASCRECLKD
jgi:hypothetical protein